MGITRNNHAGSEQVVLHFVWHRATEHKTKRGPQMRVYLGQVSGSVSRPIVLEASGRKGLANNMEHNTMEGHVHTSVPPDSIGERLELMKKGLLLAVLLSGHSCYLSGQHRVHYGDMVHSSEEVRSSVLCKDRPLDLRSKPRAT